MDRAKIQIKSIFYKNIHKFLTFQKLTQNSSIEIKLFILNRQDFAIFKTPRFFEFGRILIGEGSDLQIFGRLKKMDFT